MLADSSAFHNISAGDMMITSDRKAINGQSLGGEKRLNYHLDPGGDAHAAVAAEQGFNTNFLDLKRLYTTGNKVVLTLREHISVELKDDEGYIEHDCSCADHHPNSPCSHVYWAWDQIVRLFCSEQPQTTMTVDMGHNAGRVKVFNSEIDPVETVRTFGRRAFDAMVTRRTDPKIANGAHATRANELYWKFFTAFEPLPSPMFGPDPSSAHLYERIRQLGLMIADFTARDNGFEKKVEGILGPIHQSALEFEKTQREAERCFLSFDEYAHGGNNIHGCHVRNTPQAIRRLEDCVTHIWSRWQQDDAPAAGPAVRACLYMVRGIAIRPALRARSLVEYEGGAHGNFWTGADMFFRDPGILENLDRDDRQVLTSVKNFIEVNGTPLESTLSELIGTWIPAAARRRMG